ncbi:MAG TPA: hypothetical protein VL171_07060 [Verrucomicrobiae bacterium]|nr:hypothetical protein [Verrucomicrobiae bacterium]
MIVGINHNITDPKKWDQVTSQIRPMVEQGKLPSGIKPLFYMPAKDGRRAVCAWEANSVQDLKRFLDPLTSPGARNEYFEVNAEESMGLPMGEHAAAAR